MNFNDWSASIEQIVQAAAIVVGGGWAFMKYLKGRTFRYRAKLDILVEVKELNGAETLQLHVSMQNEGLSKIDIRAPGENVAIARAYLADEWLPDGFVDWSSALMINHALLFEDHDWVEPGETIEDDALIPVGSSEAKAVAYRVQVRVIGRRRLRILLAGAYRWLFRARSAPGALRQPSIRWTENVVVPSESGARPASGPADSAMLGGARAAASANNEGK